MALQFSVKKNLSRIPRPHFGKTDAKRPQADVCLLVHETSLLDLHSGRHALLSESDDSHHVLDPVRLAEAARRLLPDTDYKSPIALCLPPHEFIATTVVLPGVAAESLYNAVRLQLPMLLPGIEEKLLLAVADTPAGNSRHIALWLPAARADALFSAFQHQGMRLSCLLPRPCAAFPADGNGRIHDEDQNTDTYLECKDGALRAWFYVPKEDREYEGFQKQFEEALGNAAENADSSTVLSSRKTLQDWKEADTASSAYAYCFVPPGAQLEAQMRGRRRRQRRVKLISGVLAALILLSISGIWLMHKRLEMKLENLKTRTVEVSRLRAEILDIEEKTGAIVEFPRQDTAALLLKLNTLIPKETWINSFKLEDGVVELEGNSPDPAKILESLTAEPDFADVSFSRGTQGQRFGIRFRLVGIDVTGYLAEYFPTENQ